MPKQIVIKIPEWIDEMEIRKIIENYVELKLQESASREEYINFLDINVDEIKEYSFDEEHRILEELRRKAKERCQF